MSIVIDTVTYNIPLKIVSRKPEFLYKYAERLQNGTLVAELLGVYYNFDVECGMSENNVTDYAALYLKITEPVVFHQITMPAPSGYGTFDCYFANVRDESIKWYANGTQYFRGLTFSVIQKSPARVPA